MGFIKFVKAKDISSAIRKVKPEFEIVKAEKRGIGKWKFELEKVI